MRIVYLGNNWVGWQVLKWLKERDEEIVGLIIHSPNKQKYVSEILQVAELPPSKIFDGSQLHKPEVTEAIRKLNPDIGLSVLFDYILKPEFQSTFPQGVVNLHPAYLPYNRGQYPNVWSIIEGTPSGVTLHYIDNRIDTGDIIAQKEVPVEPVDTGETLYRKLERASVELLQETWPLIKAGKAPRIPQSREAGTYHRTQDVGSIDEIELERTYRAHDLINIIRARTFPPYKGAYFKVNGKRIYMRLQLEYGDEGMPCED
jgi:methionyl-tRNA formyltransferase